MCSLPAVHAALAMAERGATVLINARSPADVDKVCAEFTELGLSSEAAPFDVTDAKSSLAVIAAQPRIDILVNNAGIVNRQILADFTDEDWQRVIEVNLAACFRLARECSRSMAENGWGRIINMVSIMGVVARPNIPSYVSSKHGLLGLTKALAVELGPVGITCNAINPGYIVTSLNKPLLNDPEFDAVVKSRTPAGRWGKTDDIAGAAIYLASNTGTYVNGTMITVDGGMTAALY